MCIKNSNKFKKKENKTRTKENLENQRHKTSFGEEETSPNSKELECTEGAALWATEATSYFNCHH